MLFGMSGSVRERVLSWVEIYATGSLEHLAVLSVIIGIYVIHLIEHFLSSWHLLGLLARENERAAPRLGRCACARAAFHT